MPFSGRVGGGGPGPPTKNAKFWKGGKGRPGGPFTKRPFFFERVARGGPGAHYKKDLFGKMEEGGPGPEGHLQEKTFVGRMRGRGTGARRAPCKKYLFLNYYKPRK